MSKKIIIKRSRQKQKLDNITKDKLQKIRIAAGRILMVVGLSCLAVSAYFLYQRVNPNRLKFNDYVPTTEAISNRSAGQPKYLIISELGINLRIYPAAIVNDRWQTTFDGVSYLASSPLPGNSGNSILYGHNWKSLLGNLKNAKPGQAVKIIDDEGKVSTFEVKFVQTVDPNDKSILDQTDDSRITLYTCIGFLDSKRLVVTAVKI